MQAYAYNAALICEDCAESTMDDLRAKIPAGDWRREDSEHWPITNGADDGGGEADTPQHCDMCGVFLENPLTSEGYEYVAESIAEHAETGAGAADVIAEWRDFYFDGQESLGKADMIRELRDFGDMKSDPWGEVMHVWFSVSSELWWRGADIPKSWQYSPGAARDPREPESWFFEICRLAPTAALVEFGNYLERVDAALRRAGMDY